MNYSSDTQWHVSGRKHFAMSAVVALVSGVMIYIVFREYLPHFAPKFVHLMQRTWLDSSQFPWVNNLPSFFHAYAMVIAIASVGLRRHSFIVLGIISSLLLCLGLELVQLPLLANSLLTLDTFVSLKPLTDYASRGTYDHFDMVAICLAVLAASTHAIWINKREQRAENLNVQA